VAAIHFRQLLRRVRAALVRRERGAAAGIAAKYGAVRNARGASARQRGQAAARSHSAIGRMVVNGPHCSHS
jgi:hypothetical protein